VDGKVVDVLDGEVAASKSIAALCVRQALGHAYKSFVTHQHYLVSHRYSLVETPSDNVDTARKLAKTGAQRDVLTRATMIAIIGHLDPAVPRHRTVAMALLRKLLKEAASTVPQRTYEDAPLLRLKVRLWQALLMLLPCLPDEASAHGVTVALYDVLLKHEHPLSLRYLLEWSLLRIFLAFPNLIHALFLPYASIVVTIWEC